MRTRRTSMTIAILVASPAILPAVAAWAAAYAFDLTLAAIQAVAAVAVAWREVRAGAPAGAAWALAPCVGSAMALASFALRPKTLHATAIYVMGAIASYSTLAAGEVARIAARALGYDGHAATAATVLACLWAASGAFLAMTLADRREDAAARGGGSPGAAVVGRTDIKDP